MYSIRRLALSDCSWLVSPVSGADSAVTSYFTIEVANPLHARFPSVSCPRVCCSPSESPRWKLP
ncbi:MAG: hypothetical protein WB014_10325 [Methanosarcina sp.]